MKRIHFLASARRELVAEMLYYRKTGRGYAERFHRSVEEAAARAATFPLSGSPGMADTRFVMVSGFPFSLFYLPENNGITIIAIAHQARRPNYWNHRLKNP